MYDYIIVGAGLYGAVFAHEAKCKGLKCLVLDKRDHIGGNIYNERIEGINVHKYGAHIFHTNSDLVWEFVNQFVDFNRFINSPIANYYGEIYNLPFNMNTFNKMWGVVTPDDAKKKILDQCKEYEGLEITSLEEQAVSLVGRDIFDKLIKGYTEKQWGRSVSELPASIIKRIPVRFTYDNNYFMDKYQGIPIQGYNHMIEKMLEGTPVELGVDFLVHKDKYMNKAKKIVYCGMIDEFYDYCYGTLEYRSLKFEHTILETSNYQGNAVVNYTDSETPYTRIIEHKHFEFGQQSKTVITKEYPKEWHVGSEPYYPINDANNTKKYEKYSHLAKEESQVLFGGRLAEYKYYDMDKVIMSALKATQEEFTSLKV